MIGWILYTIITGAVVIWLARQVAWWKNEANYQQALKEQYKENFLSLGKAIEIIQKPKKYEEESYLDKMVREGGASAAAYHDEMIRNMFVPPKKLSKKKKKK